MAANPVPKMTAAEYLVLEQAAPYKSEFLNGEVFAMSGNSPAHAVLIGQMARALGDALEDSPCVVAVSELRLQAALGESYVYPDLMVVCGGFALAEGHRDMITNPSVVVEVLSESTERWDRGGKFGQYRRVASLQEYVLVSTDAVRVEWFTRESDGRWSYRRRWGWRGWFGWSGWGWIWSWSGFTGRWSWLGSDGEWR